MSTAHFAVLVFGNWNSRWIAAAVLVLCLGILTWNYGSAKHSGLARWLCPILKTVGLVALLFCLLEPLWSGQRARPGANLLAILADNSQGLTIKDRGATRSRGELLAQLVNPQHGAWQDTLEKNFD